MKTINVYNNLKSSKTIEDLVYLRSKEIADNFLKSMESDNFKFIDSKVDNQGRYILDCLERIGIRDIEKHFTFSGNNYRVMISEKIEDGWWKKQYVFSNE